MKALSLQAIGHLELIDIPVPELAPDEILVQAAASTVCTSDINDVKGNPFGIPLPVIIGHEAAGVVKAVGSKVTNFQVGDRVTTHPVHPCFTCASCRDGKEHLCQNMGHFGINRQGTFAEFFPVRQDRARKIAPSVDWATASLAEPVSVCLEALEQARLPQGGSILILGDGPFGVLTARLAVRYLPQSLVIAGRHDFRLSMAKGAQTVNTKTTPNSDQRLRDLGGGGYDAVILAVGSADGFRQGMKLLKSKGRMVVFSALPGDTAVDLFDLHVRELEIVGACNDQNLFDKAVGMLADPGLALGELITHRFALADYQKAFDLAGTGRVDNLKVTIIHEGVAE